VTVGGADDDVDGPVAIHVPQRRACVREREWETVRESVSKCEREMEREGEREGVREKDRERERERATAS
jgi:hypothetical protein